MSKNQTWKARFMKMTSPPTDIRRPFKGSFVQTDRATHEAWARFTVKRPTAAGILHLLTANVGNQNAVVISQKVIAKALGVTDRTVIRAIADLEAGNWLQVVKIGAGRESAYVLNDRVAWADKRDNLRLSRFSAEVIADLEDQSETTLSAAPLHRLPSLFGEETQLPSGQGLPPVSQPFFYGMEPDLPAIDREE